VVRIGRFAVVALLLFLVQATVIHRFSYGPLRPDLLCALAAFLALEGDVRGALVGAVVLGMLTDLGSVGRLGVSALALVAVSAGLLALRDRLVRETAWVDLVLTFLYVLAWGLAAAGGTWLQEPGARLGGLAARALGQAAFTTALAPLLYAAFWKAGIVRKRSAAFDIL
jgi:rod shape-determining protein MreD